MKMIPQGLLEDKTMYFFSLHFYIQERERLQKSLGLICFFLAVETYMKYYQQAAKSHRAITFQDVSRGGTAPGRISPCLVAIRRAYAIFITFQ